jgi:exodeoxyribonuclease VII large subunit
MGISEQLGLTFAVPARKIYAVRELVATIRTELERSFTDIYVEGEVSNYRPAESGHVYFTLKDGSAQLRVVLWRSQSRLLRFRPENGMQVIIRGRVTVYEERGELQLQAEFLEPKGAGALQLAFEQLKAKLAAEGLFDADRKRPIPALPRRIGVVTSSRAAALRDILNILQRRHESVNVLIYPAQVQGETAAAEVSAGVRYLNRTGKADVIIVARGGGSLEDLFAFNDEGLARTIAASKVPVISAIGHETDFTICDFVADRRAATPSEAAEIVVAAKHELDDRLLAFHKRLLKATQYRLLLARAALSRLAQHPSFARMRDSIARREQRLDERLHRMVRAEAQLLTRIRRQLELLESRLRHHDMRIRLGNVARQLSDSKAALETAMSDFLARRRERSSQPVASLARSAETLMLQRRSQWLALDRSLHALSPKAVLERGYALVFDEGGSLIKKASQLTSGDRVRTELGQGRFTSEVQDVEDGKKASQ